MKREDEMTKEAIFKRISFIINLEDEFHLEIPDEDVEDMKCMGEMMEYLYNRVN